MNTPNIPLSEIEYAQESKNITRIFFYRLTLYISCLLFACTALHGHVFESDMSSLSEWTTVDGANPALSSSNSSLSGIPYMALNNGVIYAQLPSTLTGDWTLRFRAGHASWQRGLYAGVFNASGTEGYGVFWDSALSSQAGGTGYISIRKFDLGSEVNWGDAGTSLSSAVDSGHWALSSPMAEIELKWEAASSKLSVRVDGVLVAQATDSSFSSFRRIYLRGNTTSYFDDVRLQTVFEDSMETLASWTSVGGASPALSSANSSLTSAPYLALNNGVARAEIGTTVTGNWTLRFKASHSTWQRALCASVLNAEGTTGYGVLWDSSTSSQANGEGYVSIRKFSLSGEPGWGDTGTQLTTPTDSGHGALSAPMAVIELSRDAASSTLYLRVNGMPIAQATDTSFSNFSRVYLRGNTTSYFDDVTLLCDTPPTAAEINAAINITSHGAVGDGVTDNQAALTSAIAAAVSQNKPLYVPPGVFRHSSVLPLNGASLFGHGYISVLAASDPMNAAVRLNGDNTYVRKCRFVVLGATQREFNPAQTSLHLIGATNFEVSGCYFEGAACNAIIASDITSAYGDIYDNWVWNTFSDGIHLTRGAHHIDIWNNHVRDTGDDMIAVVSYANQPSQCNNIWVIGNDVRRQTHGRGISCVGSKDMVIEGNYIEKSDGSGVHVVSEVSYDIYPVSNVSVLDNYITDTANESSHGGITVQGRPGYSVDNVLVDGNVILNSKSYGMRILDNAHNVTVQNNYIWSTVDSGIDCQNDIENITIASNTIEETGHYGIFSYAPNATGSFVIDDNQFTNINNIPEVNENYVDVIIISQGSTWSSVSISNNNYDNPGNCVLSRYMEISYPQVTQWNNTTSTNRPIWITGAGN